MNDFNNVKYYKLQYIYTFIWPLFQLNVQCIKHLGTNILGNSHSCNLSYCVALYCTYQ